MTCQYFIVSTQVLDKYRRMWWGTNRINREKLICMGVHNCSSMLSWSNDCWSFAWCCSIMMRRTKWFIKKSWITILHRSFNNSLYIKSKVTAIVIESTFNWYWLGTANGWPLSVLWVFKLWEPILLMFIDVYLFVDNHSYFIMLIEYWFI